jgi:ketosteroid isomerase-like protein
MLHSRRSILAAGAAGVTSLAAANQSKPQALVAGDVVKELIQQSEKANAALLRGDVETYLSLIRLSDDFTLMSPFGGTPSHGAYTRKKWDEIGSFFKNGSLKQEVVQTYRSADMVVLVVIENCHGEFGGLPAQDWSLRVTLVYRRKAEEWQLVHRHADPLAHGITLEQSALLARGSQTS